MKSITLIFICLFLSLTNLQGQSLTASEIIGNWKVIKIESEGQLPPAFQEKLDLLKETFLKAKFKFGADNRFDFDVDVKEIRIDGGHWKYDAGSGFFIIQEWKHKDSEAPLLMKFTAKKAEGKVLVFLAETPLILEVEKE